MFTIFTYKASLVSTQFRVIVVTDPAAYIQTYTHTPTHKQTGPITVHCAAASAQCKKMYFTVHAYIE